MRGRVAARCAVGESAAAVISDGRAPILVREGKWALEGRWVGENLCKKGPKSNQGVTWFFLSYGIWRFRASLVFHSFDLPLAAHE